jgi:hypothetical protein
MTAQNPIVEILSSTGMAANQNSPYQQYFLPTLTAAFAPGQITVRPPRSAQGNYDKDSNNNILNVARMIGKDADLIVTVGGLVAAEAVAKLPSGGNNWNAVFLSIIGNFPKQNSALLAKANNRVHFIGGVDLNATNLNPARAAALNVADETKICLYYNSNSHLAADELAHWNFYVGGLNLASSHDQTQPYNAARFAADFGGLAGMGAAAVVVSSDPFFASHAGDLSAAAPNGIPFCYPNELYTTRFGVDILNGASLENGYTTLANKAVEYLQGFMNGHPKSYLGVDVQDADL